jgi:hypothetical protein
MKYIPTKIAKKSGKAITRIPKTNVINASIGFDTVTPIFFSPSPLHLPLFLFS